MSKHYAIGTAGIVQALKPHLLPDFKSQVGPDIAQEVCLALRERQQRLAKAGDYEAEGRSINASVRLGFELYEEMM